MQEVTAYLDNAGNLHKKPSDAWKQDFECFIKGTVQTWAKDLSEHFRFDDDNPLRYADQQRHVADVFRAFCRGCIDPADVLKAILDGRKLYQSIIEELKAENAQEQQR